MCPGARTPEELETLLEDAFVLHLDTALLSTLLATYQRTDPFELAVQAVAARLDRVRDQHRDELNVVEAELQHRQAELTTAIEGTSARPPSEAVLVQLRERITEAITHGPMPAKKALGRTQPRDRAPIVPAVR